MDKAPVRQQYQLEPDEYLRTWPDGGLVVMKSGKVVRQFDPDEVEIIPSGSTG